MDYEEIQEDLVKFVRNYYSDFEVLHLDVPKEEVELRFHLNEEQRQQITVFFENNIEVFQGYTEETRRDLLEIDSVAIRFDEDGLYFGKSGYDYIASNAAAYYLLTVYLEDLVEELPVKMKDYKTHYFYN
ncbi:hypothetical protein KCG48_09940 [Proteiniclasticum sp. BAD-10]|uniref:Uncharacterized protein n=1 Tax=Proteiniclasticum sediminis TaxID=2804028 RepID=A0A941HRJ1_9CLOT|nr:hypothetical protein [Proteiniclasticum sediminis]MBR0576658.1 hypothetical protein [Proteiniclasticum sediminis]